MGTNFWLIQQKLWKFKVLVHVSLIISSTTCFCSAITKNNCFMIIKIKFSFSSIKFKITTYFGFRAAITWKTYTKFRKKCLQSEWLSPCGSEDGQTYIRRLFMCCPITGWNLLFLPWNTLHEWRWPWVTIQLDPILGKGLLRDQKLKNCTFLSQSMENEGTVVQHNQKSASKVKYNGAPKGELRGL